MEYLSCKSYGRQNCGDQQWHHFAKRRVQKIDEWIFGR
jgi:hypothetical protein